jgi:hypothetical protein
MKVAPRALAIGAAVTIAASCWRLTTSLASWGQLDHLSGIWTALATDLARWSTFYRPILAPEGYGGTRYFPLPFVLQAALVRLGAPPVAAGQALAVVAGLSVALATFFLLRRLGARTAIAATAAPLVLASASFQWGLTSIHGDLLPTALDVLGLALVATERREDARPRVALAALAFTLAFSAKATMVFGAASAALWLALAGKRRDALTLAGLCALGGIGVLTIVQLASGGLFLPSFLACAGAGAQAENVLRAPLLLVSTLARDDPATGALALLGALGVASGRFPRRDVASIFFAVTAVLAPLLFATRGTGFNQLVDLHVASVVLLAVAIDRAQVPEDLGSIALAAATAAGTLLAVVRFDAEDRGGHREACEALVAELPREGGPILSENPLIPVVAGERAFLLDPFMFMVVSRNRPDLVDDLRARLAAKKFRAVVLRSDPATEMGRYLLKHIHLGPEFLEALEASYDLAWRRGPYLVYLPRR